MYDEETEELSEEYENLSGDIADLTKTAKTPGGISLFTDSSKTTYKSTYEILKDISKIYNDLEDKDQAALLQKLFGKTRAQTGAAILTNFDQAEKAIRVMEDSAGSADREMGIIQDSVSYKINNLKETWTGFIQELIDRGALGDIIDVFTKLSEIVTGLASSFGALDTVMSTVFAISVSKFTGKNFINYDKENGFFLANPFRKERNEEVSDKDSEKLKPFTRKAEEVKTNIAGVESKIDELNAKSITLGENGTALARLDEVEKKANEVIAATEKAMTPKTSATATTQTGTVISTGSTSSRKSTTGKHDMKFISGSVNTGEFAEKITEEINEDIKLKGNEIELTPTVDAGKVENEIVAAVNSTNKEMEYSGTGKHDIKLIPGKFDTTNYVEEATEGINEAEKRITAAAQSSQERITDVHTSQVEIIGEHGELIAALEEEAVVFEDVAMAEEVATVASEGNTVASGMNTVASEANAVANTTDATASMENAIAQDAVGASAAQAAVGLDAATLAADTEALAMERAAAASAEASVGLKQKVLSSVGSALSGIGSGIGSILSMAAPLLSMIGNIAVIMVAMKAATALIGLAKKKIFGDQEAIDNGIKATEKIKSSLDEYEKKTKSIKSIGEAMSDRKDVGLINKVSDSIDDVAKKYVELSKGVDSVNNKNISLNSSDYKEFLDTSNQIAEIMPTLVTGYDNNGNAILNLGNNAAEASEKMKEALESEQALAHFDISSQINDQLKGIREKNEQLNKKYKKEDLTQDIKDLEEQIAYNEKTPLDQLAFESEKERKEWLEEHNRELKEFMRKQNVVDQGIGKQIGENWRSILPTITSLLKTDSSFTDLNEDVQSKILEVIGNLDKDKVKDIIEKHGFNDIELEAYLNSTYIEPFQKIEDKGMSDALIGLFSFDSSDMKFDEYVEHVDSELNKLFGKDSSQIGDWKSLLGIDGLEQQNKEIERILSDTTDKLEVTKNQFDELTMNDRNIAYDLIVNDKFEGTFDELKKRISDIKKELDEKDLFATPLLDAYNNAVKEAGENGNPGKNYDSYGAALKSLKEQYDKNLIGTDTFKKGAKMFSVGGATDADNFIENYNRFKKYFNDEEPIKGIKNFVDDMTKLNLMEKTDDGGFKTKFDDIRKAAAKANMPVELFISMFDKFEEFGGYNDFFATAEDGFSTVGELTGELAVAKAELQNLMDTQPKNKSAIKAKEEEVKSLESRLKDAQEQLMKFLSEDGIDEYTKNYSAQTKAAQNALTRLNKSENYVNADENQKQIMLEAIRSGFQNSGLDSSIYKNLGINKNGKIVLDVTASNERIDQVLEAYDAKSDKKFEQYGNKTAQQIIEQWSKEAGFSNITEYLDSIRGENGVTPEDKTENAVVNPIVTAANMLVDAINNNTAALQAEIDGKPKREVNSDINLTDRPQLNSGIMRKAGWDTEFGSTSTVLTSTYSDENGKQFVVTPILPDGKVLTPEELDNYVQNIIDGGEDVDNLVISTFEGANAEQDAENYAQALHKVQEAYYLGDEAAQKSLHTLEDYTAKELRAIDLTDDSTSEMEDSFVSLMNSMGITKDEAQQFINVLEDMGLLKIKPEFSMGGIESVDQLNQKISDQLNEGQTLTYNAKVEGVKGTTEINATEIEGEIVYTANVDGVEKEVKPVTQKDGTITYETVVKDDKGKTDKKNKDGGTATVKTEMDTTDFDKGKKEVSQGVQTLSGKEANPKVNLKGAVAASNQLSSVKQKMNSLNGKESKVTLTTVKKTEIITHRSTGPQEFNGSFHLSHAYARGTTSTSNVSIRKDETALINELGKEIVVRDGKALTFNNGYPVYANLKKNDIVFNHKQTEELERKGYVTGSHAKVYGGGSAFVNGTVDDEEELMNAFANGNSAIKFKSSSKSSSSKSSKKSSSKSSKGKSKSKKKSSSNKGKNAWEKFEEWLSNLFDWVEIRLDNLSKKTEAWTNLFEKFLNAASDNAQAAYNAAISAARNEQAYAFKASDRYLEEAIDVGLEGAKAAGTTGKGKKKKRNISDDWVMSTYERLLNDDLSETEIGKLDDKKKSIVDAMKDYIDKARDAADSTVELTESINDLIVKQRDAKVEFRKSAFSSAVEGNKGYTAETKNSVLAQSTATAEYSNNQYASTLASQESQFNTLSSNALSVSSASASSNKKVLSKLKGAKKNTYISNLNSASSAIKAKKAVSESVINYFRKMNPSVAAKYLAYNTQIALLENARAEAADNFAENMSTIIDNIAESYANLDEEAQQAIDLAQSRAENSTSYTEANNILNEVYKLQDKILTNDQAEINRYNSLLNSYKPNINTANYKGTMFGAASQSVQTAVAKARNAAVSAVSQNKMIPDSVMVQLYDYLSKGYITLSFYQSCRSWNMVFAQGEQAQAQLKIDQETAKKEKLNTFRTQTGNIESNYNDRVSEIESIKESIVGNYEDSITQGNIIKLRIQEANELQVALQNALDTGVIKKGDSAWYEYSIKIQEARNEVEKLKQTQFETELAEQFDRAIEKAQQFIDKLETINDLIADEMLYDTKSGKMTDMGWMSLGLNSQAMAKEQEVLEKYLKERDVILKAYQEGNKSFFGDKSFDEMIEENAKNILSSISSINSFKESILDLIEGLAEAELKALQKVVDKRKEALQKKKESIIGSHIFNCWKTLKLFKLQHRDEIYSSANAMKIEKIE